MININYCTTLRRVYHTVPDVIMADIVSCQSPTCHCLCICSSFSFVLLFHIHPVFQCSECRWWSICDLKTSCLVLCCDWLTWIELHSHAANWCIKTGSGGGVGVGDGMKTWLADWFLTDTFVFFLRVTDEPERISRSPVTRWEHIYIFPAEEQFHLSPAFWNYTIMCLKDVKGL